jgi:hypothetical protein
MSPIRMQEETAHINIKLADKSLENMAVFTYLGATVTIENCFYEHYTNKLNLGSVWRHSLQN